MKRMTDRRVLPLTPRQLQFWSGEQLYPGMGRFDLVVSFTLPAVESARFKRAFDAVAAAEPVLGSSLSAAEASLVAARTPCALRVLAWNQSASGDADSFLKTLAAEPLDPRTNLARATLLALRDRAVLLLQIHHLAADGWSIKLLVERTSRIYDELRDGERPRGSPHAVQEPTYREHLTRERRYLRSPTARRDRRYWEAKLAQPIRATRFYGSAAEKSAGRVLRIEQPLGAQLTAELTRAALERGGSTLNVGISNFCLAALAVLLYRMNGDERISIGTPYLNRHDERERRTIGLFMNMAVLRLALSDETTLEEALRLVAAESREASRHIRWTIPNPRLRNFDVVFNHHNVSYPSLDGRPIVEEWLHSANDDLPLTIHLRTADAACFQLQFDGDAAPFAERWRREQLVAHFLTILRALLRAPSLAVGQIKLVERDDRASLLALVRGRDLPVPRGRIEERFDDVARRFPDSIALVDGKRSLTFGELRESAERLSAVLRARGIARNIAVGAYLDRSIEAAVGLLAVLKAGGIWVPLDPAYPPDRVAFMIDDSGARVVVTDRRRLGDLDALRSRGAGSASLLPFEVVEVDLAAPARGAAPGARAAGPPPGAGVKERTSADDPAYLLYTSGSTGMPKGVAGTHRAVMNRVAWMWERFPFDADEVGVHKTSLCFIDSLWELFGPLLVGRTVLIAPDSVVRNPRAFLELLGSRAVRRIILVPSLLAMLAAERRQLGAALPGLHLWFLTGEAISVSEAEHFARALPRARLLNLYGTTEFYDAACAEIDAPGSHSFVPIASPVHNMRLYVLDGALRPLPYGVRGELCVSGVAVPREYHRRPELSRARFVDNPFEEDRYRILCRTGDAARLYPDGRIELCGRLDASIKLRGYRIEPEEIEHLLDRHPLVARAAVVPARADSGSLYLRAVIEPRAGARSAFAELPSYLASFVPHWMMPRFELRARLPLTPSGKIDRRALSEENIAASSRAPDPDARAHARSDRARSSLETKLLSIWRRVLSSALLDVNDDFFACGGDSLLAVRVTSEMERRLGASIPVSALFEAPTVAGLARRLERSPISAGGSLVALSGGPEPAGDSASEPAAFFAVPAAGSTVASFAALARRIGDRHPFYAFEFRGADGQRQPHRSVREMASDYVRELREVQPRGPYHLGGRCFGGYVALEMAHRLSELGERVAIVAIMDSREAPLERSSQRNHVGLRRYLRYYPAKARLYVRQGHFFWRLRMKLRNEWRYLANRTALVLSSASARRRTRRLEVLRHLHTRAYHEYVAEPYAGPVLLFWSRASNDQTEDLERWRGIARGGLEKVEIPCAHRELLREPYVDLIAAAIASRLDESSGAAARLETIGAGAPPTGETFG